MATLIAFALGMFLMTATIYATLIHPQLTARRWPITEGRILASKTKSRWMPDTSSASEGSSGGWYYRANVVYEYNVAGNRYEGSRVGMQATAWLGSERAAKKLAAAFAKGANVEIHYDPDNPRRAVLRPQVAVAVWVAFATSTIWFALAVWLLFKQ